MSLCDRRTLLSLLAVAPLAACGFTPVYGPGGAGNALRGRILVNEPADRLGFELAARLEDRLGRANAPSHALDYTLATDMTDLAITGANDITRININGTLDFTLIEIGSGVEVQSGQVSTFTAYSTTGSPVATAAARRDAEDRLMIALADQLISRLLAGASGWA
jgi:LPS-assembly lipoprotein